MTQTITNKIVLSKIVERLKPINPYRIILFGSQASGLSQTDSDIDIMVVTNDNFMPETYRQKSDLYLKVSTLLSELTKNTPVDLIVYTIPMYHRFNEVGSSFSKEIARKGIILYEANQPGMA